ncbi:MAG TPA: pyridoxal kinase [Roseomonas sp.]|nr:pyridoxal kinase [Roseomonas sp.]
MSVISIQSQVAHGHVGNSAAVFPMQHLGIQVTAVPTTLLSNHPHYPTMRGRVLDANLLHDLLLGVEERGLVDNCSMLLTGYLGSAENGEVVAGFVERAKRRNPALRYCCDPVMGDADLGFFIDARLQELFRQRLVPLADITTPNQFELEQLVGFATPDVAALEAGVNDLMGDGAKVVAVTGVGLSDSSATHVETYAFEGGATWKVSTPRLPCRPAGTGDLLTALFVSALVQGAAVPVALETAVSATFAVLLNTARANLYEMPIVQSAKEFGRRKARFRALVVRRGSAEDQKRLISSPES